MVLGVCIRIYAVAVEPQLEMVLADLVKHTARQKEQAIRRYRVYYHHQSHAVRREVFAPSFKFRSDLVS